MAKRVFLIVLDSFGVGAEPDAPLFGDVGTNTLGAIAGHPNFRGDNLARLGMFNLDGVTCGTPAAAPIPDGFPQELLDAFTAKTGYKVLCNKPYSGTVVIRDYGEEHMKTGALIVYTSADSVFQIAANEAIVPVEKLYEICAQARELLTGKYGVGRVIARPFVGDCAANFTRTPRRHDYSLVPPHDTMLDAILAAGKQTIGVGKIHDIFAGKGIGETIRTSGNTEGLQVTLELADRDFAWISDVQRQRVLLARAVCQQPEILLLDEPTSFLDVKGKAELMDILQVLAHEKNVAVIVTLHELELAQRLADAVVCVAPSGVSAVLAPQDAFAQDNICALFGLSTDQYAVLFAGSGAKPKPQFEHYIRSGQRLLRCGYTTGTCAALGAAGAARLLLTGHAPESVGLRTPKGIVVEVAPQFCRLTADGAACAIVKDGGDDIDATTGLPVIAAVTLLPGTPRTVTIDGGAGGGPCDKARPRPARRRGGHQPRSARDDHRSPLKRSQNI